MSSDLGSLFSPSSSPQPLYALKPIQVDNDIISEF